jgi:hypothetical protein
MTLMKFFLGLMFDLTLITVTQSYVLLPKLILLLISLVLSTLVDGEEETFSLESISTGNTNFPAPVFDPVPSFKNVMLMDLFIVLQLLNVSLMILLKMNLNTKILLNLEMVLELM